jgi:hypothetical protein
MPDCLAISFLSRAGELNACIFRDFKTSWGGGVEERASFSNYTSTFAFCNQPRNFIPTCQKRKPFPSPTLGVMQLG